MSAHFVARLASWTPANEDPLKDNAGSLVTFRKYKDSLTHGRCFVSSVHARFGFDDLGIQTCKPEQKPLGAGQPYLESAVISFAFLDVHSRHSSCLSEFFEVVN